MKTAEFLGIYINLLHGSLGLGGSAERFLKYP